MLITVIVLISTLENYQNVNAFKNSHSKNNPTDSTIFLPFNSHIADQSIHDKKDYSSSIPFP
ncbi:MAG TPA: hypothetical protein VIY08_13550 [Candidatus Nitrosocosmicus sp.]